MPNSNAKTPRTTGIHQKRPGRICRSGSPLALIGLSRLTASPLRSACGVALA